MLTTAGVRVFLAAAVGLAGSSVYGQSVISARSGLIHYTDGDVFIGEKAVQPKNSVFTDVVKDNETLRTGEEGRAEVLLTPGVFLRLAESSSFKMLSSRLSDTRVEVLTGRILLEVGELLKDNAITMVYKNQKIEVSRNGLYRIDAESGAFRVYNGEAIITRGDETFTVKQAKMVDLNSSVLMANKFDNKEGDDFFRWASRRASYLSMANIAAAKQVYDSGSRLTSSQWAYNPYYGMFTYLPFRGSYNSPFGFSFWSPIQVVRFFNSGYGYGYNNGYNNSGNSGFSAASSGPHYDSNLGYNVGSRSSGMTSSPASVSSGAASSAGAARGGDAGAGRGSSSAGGRGH